MNARQHQPAPDTSTLTEQLASRFQPQAPSAPSGQTETSGPPPDRVRRTYYFSRAVADELEAAAARVHYGSHGAVPKHQAYDEIIRAGLAHADEIAERHQA